VCASSCLCCNRNKSTASRNSSRYQPRGETEPASETGGAKALPYNRVVLADHVCVGGGDLTNHESNLDPCRSPLSSFRAMGRRDDAGSNRHKNKRPVAAAMHRDQTRSVPTQRTTRGCRRPSDQSGTHDLDRSRSARLIHACACKAVGSKHLVLSIIPDHEPLRAGGTGEVGEARGRARCRGAKIWESGFKVCLDKGINGRISRSIDEASRCGSVGHQLIGPVGR
jgi:hypothetical protein